MQILTRNQVSTIFRARSRMIKVKGNYKNGNTNINCRLCEKNEETQQHILEECETINTKYSKVSKEMIFDEDINALKETAKLIEQRLQMLEETNQPCYKERKTTTTNDISKKGSRQNKTNLKNKKTSIQQEREKKNPRLHGTIEKLRARIKQSKESIKKN